MRHLIVVERDQRPLDDCPRPADARHARILPDRLVVLAVHPGDADHDRRRARQHGQRPRLGRTGERRAGHVIDPIFADTKFNRGIDRFLRRGRSTTARSDV
jgi:hypothetical protein